jgi:hypothetical protein
MIAACAVLAGCGGRWDQEGSWLNPSCMPDGSVVWYEIPNNQQGYQGMVNSPANCPWNRR